jgi:YHS domain-containing protein
MTAARRLEKAAQALLLAALAAFLVRTAAAALVVNPATGLAISGFDPVAYFTDAKAEPGRPELELLADGAVWRFRNEGNRAAFEEHPEAYRPAFGGYDPVAIARERAVPGHPLIWRLLEGRLYFFYSEQSRDDFLADPARVLASAERKWPAVETSIGR